MSIAIYYIYLNMPFILLVISSQKAAKKLFPTLAPYISMALTPMVLTARMLKKDDPDACIAFIGPCAAKKLEASRRTIRYYITYEQDFQCYF